MSIRYLAAGALVGCCLAPIGWGTLQSATPPGGGWEYRVVTLAELHGNPLEALKDAFEGDDANLLERARRADERLADRRQEFLNGYGRDGWELVDFGVKTVTFKRPLR